MKVLLDCLLEIMLDLLLAIWMECLLEYRLDYLMVIQMVKLYLLSDYLLAMLLGLLMERLMVY